MKRERGSAVDGQCAGCARELYVVPQPGEDSRLWLRKCDGCGEAEASCMCPSTRELEPA
jgi:hypothetical protein